MAKKTDHFEDEGCLANLDLLMSPSKFLEGSREELQEVQIIRTNFSFILVLTRQVIKGTFANLYKASITFKSFCLWQ